MKEFETKKKFGQNFLSDGNLLDAICVDAGVCKDDDVLEIGAGLGSLTTKLCDNAKKVVSYEIDKDLFEILGKIDKKNLTFRFKDILEVGLEDIEKDFDGKYKIVANIPYYITTPIIFKFLGQSKKVSSLTLMVQKEVAERIVAKEGQKDYGVLSVCCSLFGDAQIKRIVKRSMFHPAPKVDSAVVRIDLKKEKVEGDLIDFVKNIFAMRRKTLLNNISSAYGFSKEQLQIKLKFDLTKRAESLSVEKIKELYKLLKNI